MAKEYKNTYTDPNSLPINMRFQKEQEEKLSPEKLKISATKLTKLFDEKFKNSEMNESGKEILLFTDSSSGYYEHNYTDKLTGTSWRATRLKDSLDIQRVTKGLDENNKLYHQELVYIRLGKEPTCIYKKYNFNNDDFSGKKPGIIIEHHDNTLSAIEMSRKLIEAIPQIVKSQKASPRKNLSGWIGM